MQLGTVYCHFSNHFQTFMLEILRRVNVFCRQSSGLLKKGCLGRPCRKSTSIGTPSIVDSGDCAMRVSLKHSMNIFTMRVKSLRFSWIPWWCGQTPVQPVPKKRRTRCSVPRADPWRIYDETESFSQRCLGAPAVDFDVWTPKRYNASVCVNPGVLL